jgi:hypothetical protein
MTTTMLPEKAPAPRAEEPKDYITGTELGDIFRTNSLEKDVNQHVLKCLHEVLGKSDKVVAIRMLVRHSGQPCLVEIGRTELMGGDLHSGMSMSITPLYKGKRFDVDTLIDVINAPREQ